MSVIKNKRSLSSLEFFHNALELRKEITDLLLRDFGVKDKTRTTNMMPKMYHMTDDDKALFTELCNRYKITSVLEIYPEWLINNIRSGMLDIMRDMIRNITSANSIYPTSEEEFYERRIKQDRAIGNCEQLLQEMQYIITVLPTDVQKYMKYVDMIEREIALLKGWRKSDNKILKRLQGTS